MRQSSNGLLDKFRRRPRGRTRRRIYQIPNEREQILKIIDHLERISERPMMFAGAKTVEAVGSFLNGFSAACFAFGLNPGRDAQRQAETERGWESNANWVVPQMRELGMTEAAIVDEMLAIEIRIWRLTLEAAAA